MEGNAMNAPEERQKSGKEEIVRRLEQHPEEKARVLRLLDASREAEALRHDPDCRSGRQYDSCGAEQRG
jgi:hypothetical protein